MPGKTQTAKRKVGHTWSHECTVIGLKFKFTKDGRETLARMVAKRGSITGMRLEREEENKYDENAIKVLLPIRIIDGKQIGYLVRETAAVLAPKLDAGSVTVKSATLLALNAADGYNTGELLITFQDKPAK